MSEKYDKTGDKFTVFFAKPHSEVFAKDVEGKRSCYGYAAKFDVFSQDLGGFYTKFSPGCFDKVLLAGADCRFLVNHDPNLLFGRTKSGTLRLKADDRGLYFEADPPSTSLWLHYAEEIARGDMDGCSFSCDIEIDQWDFSGEMPIRTVMSISALYDVGPVSYPAFTQTSVAAKYALDAARASLVVKTLRPSFGLGLMRLGLDTDAVARRARALSMRFSLGH
jgi:uncharacterized protein